MDIHGSSGFDRFLRQNLTGDLVDFVGGAFKKSTCARYDAVWKDYAAWCKTECVNAYNPTIDQVLHFLHRKFKFGVQRRTISVTVSALSHHLRGSSLGNLAKHPLVSLYQRSVFMARPTAQKRYPSWKIRDLCEVLGSQRPMKDLDFPTLTRKTACLLAVLLAARECLSKIYLHK